MKEGDLKTSIFAYFTKHDLQPILNCHTRNSATQKPFTLATLLNMYTIPKSPTLYFFDTFNHDNYDANGNTLNYYFPLIKTEGSFAMPSSSSHQRFL